MPRRAARRCVLRSPSPRAGLPSETGVGPTALGSPLLEREQLEFVNEVALGLTTARLFAER